MFTRQFLTERLFSSRNVFFKSEQNYYLTVNNEKISNIYILLFCLFHAIQKKLSKQSLRNQVYQ